MATIRGGFSKTSDDELKEEWLNAHETVLNLLYQRNVSKKEWQDLFASIYQLNAWMANGQTFIRSQLVVDIEKYVAGVEKKIRAEGEDNERLLREYIAEWERFLTQTEILPLPFKITEPQTGSSMNNNKDLILLHNQTKGEEKKCIREIMLETWREHVFHPIFERLRAAALKLIENERNGEMFDDRLVVGVRRSYVILHEDDDHPLAFYAHNFENAFVADTTAYYKSRAAEYMAANGVQSYLAYADAKLEEELQRCRKYLHNSIASVNHHMEEVTRVLVVEFMEQILAECALLVKANDIPKLRQLYRLMRRAPTGMEVVVQCIDEHIRAEGCADMRANAATVSTDPEKYVSALLALFDRFSILVREAFDDDAKMLTTRDKAFEHIVNDTSVFSIDLATVQQRRSGRVSIESKCPELLANYCDLLLRRTATSKKLTSDEIDQRLSSVLLLLKYIRNKDVFMRFHKAHLSRRLVLDMSADQDKEEQMITRMRDSGMPAEHLNKLFRMMQDIELNKSLSVDIRQSLHETHGSAADLLNMKVMNMGAWGKGGERIHVSLPRELEDLIPPVESLYRKQHNGRKLNWLHHWSTAVMNFTTAAGCSYDLEVTTFQLAVLYCWNERPHAALSLETIRLATELPETELAKTLQSLAASPKLKYQPILVDLSVSEINSRKFTDSTEFRLNHGFKVVKNGREQDRGRISLVGRLQLSMEATAKTEHEEIVALRQLRVQEAIVKVMKSRKEMPLNQLECELIQLLKPMFIPTKSMVKEQIEWLLEQGHIARKETNMDVFRYVV